MSLISTGSISLDSTFKTLKMLRQFENKLYPFLWSCDLVSNYVDKNSTVPTGRKISIVFLSGKLAKILLRNGPEVSTTFPILSLPASLLFSLSLTLLWNTVISLSPEFWIRIDLSRNGSRVLLNQNLQFTVLFQGLHRGCPSYRTSLQTSKKNLRHFKTRNCFTVFYFCGSLLFALLDPEPATQMYADPDPKPCLSLHILPIFMAGQTTENTVHCLL